MTGHTCQTWVILDPIASPLTFFVSPTNMKFSLPVLFAVFLSPAAGQQCTSSGTTYNADACSYESLINVLTAELAGTCDPKNEVRLMTGTANDEQAEAYVHQICANGWTNHRNSHFMDFEDIAEGEPGQKFTKAFYDGGSKYLAFAVSCSSGP